METVGKWVFTVKDCNDDEFFVSPDGRAIDYEEAKYCAFVGVESEAADECDRRSNEWEEQTGDIALSCSYSTILVGNDDTEFWEKVHKIAKQVEEWPQWKKEGWAVLDKRT